MKFLSNSYIKRSILIAFYTLTSAQAQVHNFSCAGATGSLGPTQTQINSAYLNTNLNNAVISNAGIQSWTVPKSGCYRIEVLGACGGGNGGFGAKVHGDFNLISGQLLKIVVGQRGEAGVNSSNSSGGGGGGSFVVLGNDSLLICAGGGGGGGSVNPTVGNASTLMVGCSTLWNGGGTNGNGGQNGITNGEAAGGAGFYSNGFNSTNISQYLCEGGKSFVNGSNGGASGFNGPYYGGAGGFGGGGSGWNSGIIRGGGGGGYSGGQGGSLTGAVCGGGGGSFNSGYNQLNQEGIGTGDGSIVIIFLHKTPIDVLAPGDPTSLGTTTTSITSIASNNSSSSEGAMRIYPNPNNGVFYLETKGEAETNYALFNSAGTMVSQKISAEKNMKFDISDLSCGIYFLKAGNYKMYKVIKR